MPRKAFISEQVQYAASLLPGLRCARGVCRCAAAGTQGPGIPRPGSEEARQVFSGRPGFRCVTKAGEALQSMLLEDRSAAIHLQHFPAPGDPVLLEPGPRREIMARAAWPSPVKGCKISAGEHRSEEHAIKAGSKLKHAILRTILHGLVRRHPGCKFHRCCGYPEHRRHTIRLSRSSLLQVDRKIMRAEERIQR